MVKAVVRISIDRRAAEQTRQALLQIVLCASGAGGPVTGDDGAADASALNGTPFRASIDAQRLYIGCPDTRDAEALAAFIGHYRANIGGILAVDVTGVSWVRASYTAERGQRATLIVGPYTSTSEARARALSWTFGDGSTTGATRPTCSPCSTSTGTRTNAHLPTGRRKLSRPGSAASALPTANERVLNHDTARNYRMGECSIPAHRRARVQRPRGAGGRHRWPRSPGRAGARLACMREPARARARGR